MLTMANRAYVSVWSKGFTEATMLEQLEQLLKTVPYSAEGPGLVGLVVRAVDPSETSLVEHDLRFQPLGPAELVELAREHPHADSAYEVQICWDLWVYDTSLARWQLRPQRLEIICHGEEYDGGAYAEAGHFQADIGFEHLFTGHAGLLGPRADSVTAPQHPAEAAFLAVMARPENLREYHQKTCANIQKLMDWMQAVEEAIPLERYCLWSEGEENFEARLDEILAVR
jgi:hypothetical protein